MSGDVDLLLDDENYQKAKELLIPLSEVTESEDVAKKHLALRINGFEVELHGKMPFGISCRADDVVDEVLEDSLLKGRVSKWSVDETDVLLPNPDNHIVIVFTHFLRHFFIEGVGLRQICDWCRLLYIYRDSLNYELLESRIKAMGLMSEWKAFYNLASRYLGMPDLDSELTIHDSRFDKKADNESGDSELLYATGALMLASIDEEGNKYFLSSLGEKLIIWGTLNSIDVKRTSGTQTPSLLRSISKKDFDSIFN